MTDLSLLFAEYLIKGYVLSDAREVRSGKEAIVYRVESGDTSYALKVYKKREERGFKRNEQYLAGKVQKNHSVQKAIDKGNAFSKDFLSTTWVKREFDVIKNLNKHGASVPQVFEWTSTSILMEFIGDNDVAPRLVDIKLDAKFVQGGFDAILDSIGLFLKTGIVHSDLSAYNILWWKDKPYIIDFPQAIDIRENPHTNELLKRDIDNVVNILRST